MTDDEMMALAVKLFGGREEAERWFASEVIALDHQIPSQLIQTQEGRQKVEDVLVRLDYGVYT